jgi:hypothetical protein
MRRNLSGEIRRLERVAKRETRHQLGKSRVIVQKREKSAWVCGEMVAAMFSRAN